MLTLLKHRRKSFRAAAAQNIVYGPEGFEGTGTPTGWINNVGSGGSISYDDTSDPGTGSKSLKVLGNNGTYATLDLGSVYSNCSIILQEKHTVSSSIYPHQMVFFATDTNNAVYLRKGASGGSFQVVTLGGATLTPTSDNVSVTDWHYIKVDINVSSTTLTLTKSTSSNFTSPDTGTSSSFSYQTGFTGVRYILVGNFLNLGTEILFDELSVIDNS